MRHHAGPLLRLWDTAGTQLGQWPLEHKAYSMSVSPSGRYVAISHEEHGVSIDLIALP